VAATLARDSTSLAAELGAPALLAGALYVQGEIALSQGNYAAAREHLAGSLAMTREGLPECQTLDALEGLAAVAAARGQPERALRLAAAAGRSRETLRLPAMPIQVELLQRRLLPARAALPDDQRTAAWLQGSGMTLAAAIDEALGSDHPTGAVTDTELRPEVKWLTRREREVAALVGEGLHNHQVGVRLGIAVHTVEVHVSHILGKLSMSSRAQLAVWAVEHGLRPVEPR
jgi:non-specific serine/threonine protein kinase